MKCNKTLTHDEKAVYKRLINRGTTEYLCKSCLADHLKCSEELIEEKIDYFKKMGCTLFYQD